MYKVATSFVLTIAFLSIASVNIAITRWQNDHRAQSTEKIAIMTPPAKSAISLPSSHPSVSSSNSVNSVASTTATVYQKSELKVVSQLSSTSEQVSKPSASATANHS